MEAKLAPERLTEVDYRTGKHLLSKKVPFMIQWDVQSSIIPVSMPLLQSGIILFLNGRTLPLATDKADSKLVG